MLVKRAPDGHQSDLPVIVLQEARPQFARPQILELCGSLPKCLRATENCKHKAEIVMIPRPCHTAGQQLRRPLRSPNRQGRYAEVYLYRLEVIL